MAMITCEECGKEISDKAGVCPHCGYPIQAIKNAQIDQQNRAYYKQLNKTRIIYNVFAFFITFGIGIDIFRGEVQTWQWVIYFVVLAIFLWLCFSWIPWIVGFIFHIAQRYKHIPKYFVLVSACAGFAIGGCVGMGMH